MRTIKTQRLGNDKTIEENLEALSRMIDPIIADLQKDGKKNQKKIIELCHVGKFLMLANQEGIITPSEQPDFIVDFGDTSIGIEHQIVVDSEEREYEGFFENIFSKAEDEMRYDHSLPNFLANCYIHQHLTYQMSEKAEFIQIVKTVVSHYIKTKDLLENKVIESISAMPHDRITLSPNLGAWWQKEITAEIISSAVAQKDIKYDDYIRNTNLKQWLLLVIDSLKDSSYQVESDFEIELNTRFDKVFLLEDFRNRVFELK